MAKQSIKAKDLRSIGDVHLIGCGWTIGAMLQQSLINNGLIAGMRF